MLLTDLYPILNLQNPIWNENKNCKYTQKRTFQVLKNETYLRQFFLCPSDKNGHNAFPFLFCTRSKSNNQDNQKTYSTGYADIFLYKGEIQQDGRILPSDKIYMRTSIDCSKGYVHLSKLEYTYSTAYNFQLFFYPNFILILDMKKLSSSCLLQNKTLEKRIITLSDGKTFDLLSYKLSINELYKLDLLDFINIDTIQNKLTTKHGTSDIDYPLFQGILPNYSYIQNDPRIGHSYNFKNLNSGKTIHCDIKTFLEIVSKKLHLTDAENQSSRNKIYRKLKKSEKDIMKNYLPNNKFEIKGYNFEIWEDKNYSIQNNSNLKSKPKYDNKTRTKINTWLNRHNNQFNPKWTPDEISIAEYIIKSKKKEITTNLIK